MLIVTELELINNLITIRGVDVIGNMADFQSALARSLLAHRTMRVFVLNTGRCGSTTFFKACSHIENYTSGHETLSREVGAKRFDYPDNHIEVDNRLSWHLGELHFSYTDVFYVHLKRDREQVANSFLKRFGRPRSIIDSFCSGIRMTDHRSLTRHQMKEVCYDYVDTVNTNIEHFLTGKNHITAQLENIEPAFEQFFIETGAKGDLEKSLMEFKIKYNAL